MDFFLENYAQLQEITTDQKIPEVVFDYHSLFGLREENTDSPQNTPKPSSFLSKYINLLSSLKDEKGISTHCSVCYENEPVIAFNCGHQTTCAKCSLTILKTTEKCPVCRIQIEFAIKIFK